MSETANVYVGISLVGKRRHLSRILTKVHTANFRYDKTGSRSHTFESYIPIHLGDKKMRKPLYCCPEYIVDSDGYILSKRFGTPLKYSINSKGYAIVNIMINGKRKGLGVHTAIAHTFLKDYKNGLQVNHKDGNKLNNHINNLEWVTGSENMRHAVDVLGNCINDKNSNSKSIQALDKQGNIIYDSTSIAECAKDIAKQKQQNYKYIETAIWRVLKGYRKTYMGLYWQYK